jgi:hypothetical protein
MTAIPRVTLFSLCLLIAGFYTVHSSASEGSFRWVVLSSEKFNNDEKKLLPARLDIVANSSGEVFEGHVCFPTAQPEALCMLKNFKHVSKLRIIPTVASLSAPKFYAALLSLDGVNTLQLDLISEAEQAFDWSVLPQLKSVSTLLIVGIDDFPLRSFKGLVSQKHFLKLGVVELVAHCTEKDFGRAKWAEQVGEVTSLVQSVGSSAVVESSTKNVGGTWTLQLKISHKK